ncbi:winged helix-turn-helix transcriptional regulator [Thermobacillus xylanilyticus]|uniref:winged helix-turn-helix transcriptional regulator n=1 Tax=Thermobacillus xylanilyticus TaxID=76633 RepID=UPI001FD3F3D9|nr:helix-turn-helix domain-containing protein [Thermobacillus xylanilyticus]
MPAGGAKHQDRLVLQGRAFAVIAQLYYQPQGFNQLRRNLGSITVKSLTDTLRHLERHQIVKRRVFPTIPVSVEYSLTEKGREYRAILLQMRQWGEKWIAARKE